MRLWTNTWMQRYWNWIVESGVWLGGNGDCLFLLAQVMARRGLTHKQSKSDPNLARIWEIIDGRSVPVLQVNLVDGSFLEMKHYPLLDTRTKIKLADAQGITADLKQDAKKADANISPVNKKHLHSDYITERG